MKKILFTALLALLATGVGAQEQQKAKGGGVSFHRREDPPRDFGQEPEPQRHLLGLLGPRVSRKRDSAQRRRGVRPVGDVDRAQRLFREGGEVRPYARFAQSGRRRRFARRDRRDQEIRHRADGGLSGSLLRHRLARLHGDRPRRQGVYGRRDRRRQVDDGLAARPGCRSGRLSRPQTRKIHLEGQGVYAAVVRCIAGARHGRLRRDQLLYAPPLLRGVHPRSARQLDVGGRSGTCLSTR